MVVLRVQEDRGGTAGERPRDDRQDGDLDTLSAHVSEIAGQLARLARIRIARARLRAQSAAFSVLGGIVLALVVAAAALAGVRLVARGLTAGLGELVGERVWLAELWAGLLLLAGTAALIVSIRWWSERRLLRDLRRRDERREIGRAHV